VSLQEFDSVFPHVCVCVCKCLQNTQFQEKNMHSVTNTHILLHSSVCVCVCVCVCVHVFLSQWGLNPESTQTHGDSCHCGPRLRKQAHKTYRIIGLGIRFVCVCVSNRAGSAGQRSRWDWSRTWEWEAGRGGCSSLCLYALKTAERKKRTESEGCFLHNTQYYYTVTLCVFMVSWS